MTNIRINVDNAIEAFDWCASNFQAEEWEVISEWPSQYCKFSFEHRQHATMFALKFS